ncbi:4680_t:CDS:2 [Gigaspora margarita]|uniref:4680_t:CDS:1 n=1 Tax=Gigaspora margarita TaxID=4874 RepID=A0ABM8W5V8_GIGMA|nr:4680_t:CDS:2 [Gigaspora margarita]
MRFQIEIRRQTRTTDGSTTSKKTVGASETSSNQTHDSQRLATMIHPTNESIPRHDDSINRSFDNKNSKAIYGPALDKTNAGGNEHQNQEHEQTPNIEGSLGQIEGNCPLTPIIKSLIIKTSSDIQGNSKQESDGSIKYKITTRKIPAIDYIAFKQLPAVQGMNNPKAIETERIHV